jgi:DNA primase
VGAISSTPRAHEERDSYGFRQAIKAVKANVTIEDYLASLDIEVRNGRSRCPIHKGSNRTALKMTPGGRWHCFACNEGGDLLNLAQAVEGGEKWEVMGFLAEEFGVAIPCRNGAWARRQAEKASVEGEILKAMADTYQRRFFRTFGDLALENIEDEGERAEEARRLFEGFRPAAVAAARNRWERRRG